MQATPLMAAKIRPFTWGVPSWDGRHFAVFGAEFNANIWMVENF
jgi:hypothetical protein